MMGRLGGAGATACSMPGQRQGVTCCQLLRCLGCGDEARVRWRWVGREGGRGVVASSAAVLPSACPPGCTHMYVYANYIHNMSKVLCFHGHATTASGCGRIHCVCTRVASRDLSVWPLHTGRCCLYRVCCTLAQAALGPRVATVFRASQQVASSSSAPCAPSDLCFALICMV